LGVAFAPARNPDSVLAHGEVEISYDELRVHRKFKSIWCTIWILGALLVVATLDAQPDPPAVNPSPTLCKVLKIHVSVETVARHCESVRASYPFVNVRAGDAHERFHPSDRMSLTVQAADPSPPAIPAGLKPIQAV
jgi:hypothetical protein